MNFEVVGVVLFIALCFGLMKLDNDREVIVIICEKNDMTTYVGRQDPPNLLKFGICRANVMPNHQYYRLSRTMRRNVK